MMCLFSLRCLVNFMWFGPTGTRKDDFESETR